MSRILTSLNIKTANAELTTSARAIACADVRNAVSMCAAQHRMVQQVDHFLILNMGKQGLLKAQLAFKFAVSVKMIKESFRRAGIYYTNTGSYDILSTILGNCTSEISVEEEAHIKDVVPQLAKILITNGELLDIDFEQHNIRNNITIGIEDNLVIS
jgi:hypothetical protein